MTVLFPECALLTAVFIFSGVANVLSSWQPCEERLQETAEEGEWVDVNAICYPNGTVSYNWSSDPRTQRLQIEYQCYNATIHQDVPNPREPLLEWADIRSGSRTEIVQPWEDATSCIFSGCYESGPEMQYRKYWIQNFTCSINRAMASASVGIHMASTSQPPLKHALTVSLTVPTVSPTVPTVSPTVPTVSLAVPTVSPTVQPDSEDPNNTGWLIAVAMTVAVVVLITTGIVCLVIFVKHIIKYKQHCRPIILCDDKIDDSFSPVLDEHKEISESIETIVCTLNYHHLEHKNTPRSYIRHSSPETDYTSNDTMNRSKNPNLLVPLDEHSESASVTNMNVYVGTQWTVEGEEGEVLEATETVKEVSQAEEEEEEEEKEEDKDKEEEEEKEEDKDKEEEEEKEEDKDEEEKERSKVTCHDESNSDRVNSNTYESLEPKLPVDEFPTIDAKETDVPLSPMSFYTHGGYQHSVQGNTSRTSGYISSNAMWNRSPILLSKAYESEL